MADTTVHKVDSAHSPKGDQGQKYLASGKTNRRPTPSRRPAATMRRWATSFQAAPSFTSKDR
jgi:hypothetical protein